MSNRFGILGTSPRYYCRVEPVSKTNSITEGLQAKVKDPLWMAARQWQTGEFLARNGGHPVRVEASYVVEPINRMVRVDGRQEKEIHLHEPMELAVEKDNAYWDAARLEYIFKIRDESAKVEMQSQGYGGRNLDWYDLLISKFKELQGDPASLSATPSQINFKGRPSPRFWEFEDRRVAFDGFTRPSLNYLLMAFVQFALVYANDWIYFPLEMPIGYIRDIREIKIVDSFGYVNYADAVVDKTANKEGWEAFTISRKDGGISKGSLLFIPNNLCHSIVSEPMEKIDLFRDESANIVWAVERKILRAGESHIVNRDDEERGKGDQPKDARPFYWDIKNKKIITAEEARLLKDEDKIGPLDAYRSNSYVPANWIPFISKRIKGDQIKLFQAGLMDADDQKINTHFGVILSESEEIFEENIPRTGVTVEIVHELARDTDGNPCSWVSRTKRTAVHQKSSGLEFDGLIKNT